MQATSRRMNPHRMVPVVVVALQTKLLGIVRATAQAAADAAQTDVDSPTKRQRAQHGHHRAGKRGSQRKQPYCPRSYTTRFPPMAVVVVVQRPPCYLSQRPKPLAVVPHS